MLCIPDMKKGWMSLSCSGRYSFPLPSSWTSRQGRICLAVFLPSLSYFLIHRSYPQLLQMSLTSGTSWCFHSIQQPSALQSRVGVIPKNMKTLAFSLELKEFLFDRHSAVVLLEFCFLVWGKDTSRQCLEFRRAWQAQYLAGRGVSASAKKRGLRRGLVGTKIGCSAKHRAQLPKVAWVRPALLNKPKCLAQQLQESLSLCLWKGECQLGLWRLTSGAHRALLPALHYSETLQDLVEPFPSSSSSSSFSCPSSSFAVSKCSVVQGGVCSQTRKLLRSSHIGDSHWYLEEIHRVAFSFTILTLSLQWRAAQAHDAILHKLLMSEDITHSSVTRWTWLCTSFPLEAAFCKADFHRRIWRLFLSSFKFLFLQARTDAREEQKSEFSLPIWCRAQNELPHRGTERWKNSPSPFEGKICKKQKLILWHRCQGSWLGSKQPLQALWFPTKLTIVSLLSHQNYSSIQSISRRKRGKVYTSFSSQLSLNHIWTKNAKT